MNESSLSFISSLSSSKDDDSLILPDTVNVNASSSFSADVVKTEAISPDLLNISFDKCDLNSEVITSNLTPVGSVSNIPQFTVLNECNLTKSNVQSPLSNFVTNVSSAKTVELSTLKTGVSNSNKANAAQLLIFQKPPSTMPAVIVGKGVPVASVSSVALVQPSTVVSSGTKILTLPAINAAGNLISTVTPTGSGKTGDVKILLGGVPCSSSLVTSKSVSSTIVSSANSNFQGQLKRAVTPSSTGQMVTKVIITNNATPNQPLVSPVPVSASGSTPVAISQPQSILLTSPNKTITLPRSVLNVSGSQQIIRTLPGTPSKQYVLSPVKPTQKVAYGPVTYSRSPRRIAPATNATISTLNSGGKLAALVCPTSVSSPNSSVKMPVPQSPTKVILKPVPQTILKPVISVSSNNSISTNFSTANTSGASTVQVTQSTSSASTQPVQVSGNKLHYVRLVTAPSTSTTTSMALSTNVSTVTTVVTLTSTSQIRPTVPIAPAKLVAPKQIGPKFLIPAATNSQVRSTSSLNTSQIGQLSSGTLIPVPGGSQSYVMLPAQYVTQLQQPATSQVTGTQMLNILPAPTPPSSSNIGAQSAFISLTSNPPNTFHSTNISSAHHSPRHVNGRTPNENDSRPRKPCNCTKSQCLKLYCDCFANGEFCNNCNCNNCFNNLAHEEERQKAIKACLDRNPLAFHPKIGKSREGDQERRHTKGCNCKRSGCLKNYCECYEAKILCTNLCKCIGCKNFEDSSERKTLMHLADAAEVRVQQQAAAKTNLSSEILDIPSKPPVMSRTGERLPFAFVTDDVVKATCLCLLAQASDAEKSHTSEEEIERLVLQEFSRCLVKIIDCASKTKVTKMDIS